MKAYFKNEIEFQPIYRETPFGKTGIWEGKPIEITGTEIYPEIGKIGFFEKDTRWEIIKKCEEIRETLRKLRASGAND